MKYGVLVTIQVVLFKPLSRATKEGPENHLRISSVKSDWQHINHYCATAYYCAFISALPLLFFLMKTVSKIILLVVLRGKRKKENNKVGKLHLSMGLKIFILSTEYV